jgi:hypothetical protein
MTFMNRRIALLVAVIGSLALFPACKPTTPPAQTNANAGSTPVSTKTPGPLPDNGYKAEITCPDPPIKLRAGQKETITIKVKNTSDVVWWLRGAEFNDRVDNKFYIAAGNHWLDKDGKITSETEGHNAIPKNLNPGEETEMTLEITAPQAPGEWILDLDMVQEGVTWFGEKGSPTTKVKVMVVK